MDDLALKLRGALGIVAILGLAWVLSTHRRAVKARMVVFGLGLQFVFALLILRTEGGRRFFAGANQVIQTLLGYSQEGAQLVFGDLAKSDGAAGFVFAVGALTPIIFFASLMSILYHYGVMQAVVKGVAWLMMKTLRTSGAETLSAAANIFVGQTEAPILVKPFILRMTKSEIMTVMTGGFATVAGGIMAIYVSMLAPVFPEIGGHLLAASVMAAPAGLMMAKIFWPETESPETSGQLVVNIEKSTRNGIDAAAAGATDGLKLALNVAAMLIAFVALIALADGILGWLGGKLGVEGLSIANILKHVFWPLAYAMGIERAEVPAVAGLLGTKMVATELVAFTELKTIGEGLSPRTLTMTSYALCGFANFASIAIQVGGIGAMAPERRSDLAQIGLRAMFAGFLTTCLTATVAGLLI